MSHVFMVMNHELMVISHVFVCLHNYANEISLQVIVGELPFSPPSPPDYYSEIQQSHKVLKSQGD